MNIPQNAGNGFKQKCGETNHRHDITINSSKLPQLIAKQDEILALLPVMLRTTSRRIAHKDDNKINKNKRRYKRRRPLTSIFNKLSIRIKA